MHGMPRGGPSASRTTPETCHVGSKRMVKSMPSCGSPDVAVTAFAVRMLDDAGKYVVA